MRIIFTLFILIASFFNLYSKPVEEFQANGPMDFHNHAMNTFVEMRRADPSANLSHDGEFLKKATQRAIQRMVRKPDEELAIVNSLAIEDGSQDEKRDIQLQLPGPEGQDSFLTAAVNDAGSKMLTPQQARATAILFTEEVGLGAISKTGALPMGSRGEWLSLAEEKLKKEAGLDYQALLWEMGSEVAESKFMAQGGVNETYEQLLLDSMEVWYAKGGGKIHFVQPVIMKEQGFKLKAAETIHADDVIIAMPMKLIMCRQTARNVVIASRGKYLGDELTKTYEKNELWGMAMFLLHEYYKEINGNGSKWGPFIRTLRMRYLSTPTLQALKGTIAAHMSNQWLKGSDSFMWWSVGADGPCSPTTGICRVKPKEKGGDSRFNIHQIRWAYWVVKQNAVKIKQLSTGLEFIALIPYYHMLEKKLDAGGGITFDLDGTISLRVGKNFNEQSLISINPGNYSDSEYFLRYFDVPEEVNPHTEIKLSLPGVIPKGSKFHYCLKGTQREQNRDDCKATYKSESMFWKSKVLTEWRQLMNLPPRLQELRMWATRLHLYGGSEEMALISKANQLIAGLPISTDEMPAEEQLMLLGIARDNNEAAVIATGPQGERPPPQLYAAPDPSEDWEAQRSMENLATLAVQAQNVYRSANTMLNATQVVLNQTRDFFVHGVLPMAGLDELDTFLLKKIGMLAHCGFENDMKIVYNNITEELFCAMRVHLMNETEMHVFCPKDARVFEENCQNVEFMNYTAISETNEMAVIGALRSSIHGLLSSYPTTLEDDLEMIRSYEDEELFHEDDESEGSKIGPIMHSAIRLRSREKEILHTALQILEVHEEKTLNGSVMFQLALKAEERKLADIREAEHQKFLKDIRERAAVKPELAYVPVDMGKDVPKLNLTLEEGNDIKQTVLRFCQKHGIKAEYHETLEKALRARVVHPPPLKLMLGVIIPATGDRKVLAIPEIPGVNLTVETGVFCMQNDPLTKEAVSSSWCQALIKRVEARINTEPVFVRKILQVVPIDAPDTRKLKLVVREGEQHDLVQLVADFLEVYHMSQDSLMMLANEVNKRLPSVALQIPIAMSSKRSVTARFSQDDNITAVVEAFCNLHEIDDQTKIAIFKRARYGMAPGTFLV